MHADIYHAAVAEPPTVQGAPIEVAVDYGQLNRFFWDYIHNISQGGTFIRTEQPLDIGTEFHFSLRVPDIEQPLSLRGRVHWNLHPEQCKPGQVPGMGIGFVYDSEIERQRIIATVERLMVASLGPLLYEHLVGRHLPSVE